MTPRSEDFCPIPNIFTMVVCTIRDQAMNELFRNDSIRVESHPGPSNENFGLFWMDMPKKSANVLTSKMFEDIDHAWDFVESQNLAGIVILSAKEKIFVAGADLVAISETLDWSDERIHQFCEDGRNIFSRFRSNSFPVVAAVHGACVGVLLSPFDPVLWDRQRVQQLFDFEQVLEIYKPKEQRVYGYYVLPILAGDRLVGRVDLKAHRNKKRDGGRLEVRALHFERDEPSAEDRAAAASALGRLANSLALSLDV